MYSYFLFLLESVMIPLGICQLMFSLYMKYCSWFLSNFIIYAFSIVSLGLISFDIFLCFLSFKKILLISHGLTYCFIPKKSQPCSPHPSEIVVVVPAHLQSQLNKDVQSSTQVPGSVFVLPRFCTSYSWWSRSVSLGERATPFLPSGPWI